MDKNKKKYCINCLTFISSIGLGVFYAFGLIYSFKLTNEDMFDDDDWIKGSVICAIIADCCVLIGLLISFIGNIINIFTNSELVIATLCVGWGFPVGTSISSIFWIISIITYLMRADDIMSNSDGQIFAVLNLFIPMCIVVIACIGFVCVSCILICSESQNFDSEIAQIKESCSRIQATSDHIQNKV